MLGSVHLHALKSAVCDFAVKVQQKEKKNPLEAVNLYLR